MHCPDGGFFLYIIESICETNIKKKEHHLFTAPTDNGTRKRKRKRKGEKTKRKRKRYKKRRYKKKKMQDTEKEERKKDEAWKENILRTMRGCLTSLCAAACCHIYIITDNKYNR